MTTRSTCSTHLFTCSARLCTRSTRFSTRSSRLSIRLSIRSTRLSTHSTHLSIRSICLSTGSTRSTICRSFFNWSLQHQISFKHIFLSNYHLSNFFWYLWRQTNRYSSKKVNTWTPSGYFPFFISFFCWNEINKKLQEKTRERSEAVASAWKFIKKETVPQVFSCEFCEISKNTFSNRTPPVAASERWKKL